MNKSPLPEVRIEFSYLIYDKIAKPMWAHYRPNEKLMEPQRVQEVVADYTFDKVSRIVRGTLGFPKPKTH